MIPFAPETSYVVPSAERDSLPHASEGMRQVLGFVIKLKVAAAVPSITG